MRQISTHRLSPWKWTANSTTNTAIFALWWVRDDTCKWQHVCVVNFGQHVAKNLSAHVEAAYKKGYEFLSQWLICVDTKFGRAVANDEIPPEINRKLSSCNPFACSEADVQIKLIFWLLYAASICIYKFFTPYWPWCTIHTIYCHIYISTLAHFIIKIVVLGGEIDVHIQERVQWRSKTVTYPVEHSCTIFELLSRHIVEIEWNKEHFDIENGGMGFCPPPVREI